MSTIDTIEVKTEADLETVLRINEQVQKTHFDGILPDGQIDYMISTLWTPEKFRAAMEKDGEQFFLFRENGDDIGFYSYVPTATRPESNPEETGIKLSHIFLLEASRGKGLFSRAFNDIAETGRALGHNSMFLTVNRGNNAVDIYRHKGFEVTAEIDIDIGNGYVMNDYVMKCDI